MSLVGWDGLSAAENRSWCWARSKHYECWSSLNVLAGCFSWASHWTQTRAARNKSISSPEPQPNGQFVHRKWGESLWVNYLSQIIHPALPDRAAFCVWSLRATVAGIKGSFVRGLSAEDVVENYIKDEKSRVWPKVPNPSTTSELLSWSFDRRRKKNPTVFETA